MPTGGCAARSWAGGAPAGAASRMPPPPRACRRDGGEGGGAAAAPRGGGQSADADATAGGRHPPPRPRASKRQLRRPLAARPQPPRRAGRAGGRGRGGAPPRRRWQKGKTRASAASTVATLTAPAAADARHGRTGRQRLTREGTRDIYSPSFRLRPQPRALKQPIRCAHSVPPGRPGPRQTPRSIRHQLRLLTHTDGHLRHERQTCPGIFFSGPQTCAIWIWTRRHRRFRRRRFGRAIVLVVLPAPGTVAVRLPSVWGRAGAHGLPLGHSHLSPSLYTPSSLYPSPPRLIRS